jgi:hypothetical protein
MPIAKRNLRGLREIRTLSGQADDASLPHRAHMKLACLEMEKARRRTERNVAMQRIKSIDERLQDIESEETVIRQAMAGEADDPARVSPQGTAGPGHPRGKRRVFKVKY